MSTPAPVQPPAQPPHKGDALARVGHPLEPFLDAWFASRAETGSTRAYLRVYRALSLETRWDREGLLNALSALLTYDGESARAFNRHFDRFFPQGQAPDWLLARLNDPAQFSPERAVQALKEALEPVSPGAPTSVHSTGVGVRRTRLPREDLSEPDLPRPLADPSVSTEGPLTTPTQEPAETPTPKRSSAAARVRWKGLLAEWGPLLLLALAGLVGVQTAEPPTEFTPPPPVLPTPVVVGEEMVSLGTQSVLPLGAPQILKDLPQLTGPTVQEPLSWQGPLWLLGWGIFLVLGAALLGAELLRERRRAPAPTLIAQKDSSGMLLLPEPPQGFVPYSSHALDRLAYLTGVLPAEEQHILDAHGTVYETLRSGGVLTPRYRLERLPRALRLLVPPTWRQEPVARAHLLALRTGIAARGVEVRWEVYRRGRPPAPVLDAVSLLFLDAEQPAPPDLPWRLPDTAFVALQEPALWDAQRGPFPVRVYSLEPLELEQALHDASQDLRRPDPIHEGTFQDGLERLGALRTVAAMAAECSLFGGCSLAAVEALRREHAPETAPLMLQRIAQLEQVVGPPAGRQRERVVITEQEWSFSPLLVEALLPGLSPALRLKALAWQRTRLEQAAVDPGSEADIRKQVLLASLEVQRVGLERARREPPLDGLQPDPLEDSDAQALEKALQTLASLPEDSLARQRRDALQACGGVWRAALASVEAGDDRLRWLAGRAGVLKEQVLPGLRRGWKRGLAGAALAGLVLLLMGLLGLNQTPSRSLELAVEGEVAWAIAWWPEAGPIDPARVTLAEGSSSSGWQRLTGSAVRRYALEVPPDAQQARIYAVAAGGLVVRDIGLERMARQVLELRTQATLLSLREAGEPGVTVLRSRRTPPPREGEEGSRFRVEVLSVSPEQLERVAQELERGLPVDLVLGEARASLPEKAAAVEKGFVCPDGAPPCVHYARLEDTSSPWVAVGRDEARREVGEEGLVFVSVPAGEFTMGSDDGWDSEKPPHKVKLGAFKLSKTEVTVAQYGACVQAGKCTEPETQDGCNWKVAGRENHPINCVDWNQAKAFTVWLSKLTGQDVRLPSEAQWEYAARGPEGRKYPWGNNEPTSELANYGSNVGSTTPVGQYPKGASWVGALDMVGNVWEWTEDCWHDTYLTAPEDGSAWTSDCSDSARRVFRGGSWSNVPDWLRGADRHGAQAGNRYRFRGFRPVLVVPQSDSSPSITWISVPAGEFTMGSNDGWDNEKPPHKVKLGAFKLSKTEVTVAQYGACVQAGKCTEPTMGDTDNNCNWKVAGRENHPINCVDWDQAKAFTVWLSKVMGQDVRLPSEAQWEYAARGPEDSKYPWGNGEPTSELANYGYSEGSTTPVGQYPKGASWVGALDMAGNVWEWTEDCWHANYTNAPKDGSAWTSACSDSALRVLRGGSWDDGPVGLRGAFRNRRLAGGGGRGFRPVLLAPPGGDN